MIDLDDPRTAKIADVISNKTTKRILSLLAEQELSETELSKLLEIPLNTIEYNINKLEETGLIEKAHGFFWSEKGKKIYKYKVSNKKIVISPKTKIKGIIPSLVITTILAILIWIFTGTGQIVQKANDEPVTILKEAASTASSSSGIPPAITDTSSNIPSILSNSSPNTWAWFLLGAFIALAILLTWNLFKTERRSN